MPTKFENPRNFRNFWKECFCDRPVLHSMFKLLLLQNTAGSIVCYEVIQCNIAENAQMRWQKFVVVWKRRNWPDVFSFIRRTDACWLWWGSPVCLKVKQDSLDSIFTKGKAAPGQTFPLQGVTIIQLIKCIRNTPVTCHHWIGYDEVNNQLSWQKWKCRVSYM